MFAWQDLVQSAQILGQNFVWALRSVAAEVWALGSLRAGGVDVTAVLEGLELTELSAKARRPCVFHGVSGPLIAWEMHGFRSSQAAFGPAGLCQGHK